MSASPDIARDLSVIAAALELSTADLIGKVRPSTPSQIRGARQFVAMILQDECGHGDKAIARALGVAPITIILRRRQARLRCRVALGAALVRDRIRCALRADALVRGAPASEGATP